MSLKNYETDVIKKKYQEMIEDYKKDLDKNKKINSENLMNKDSKTHTHQLKYFKSTLNLMIDIIDLELYLYTQA